MKRMKNMTNEFGLDPGDDPKPATPPPGEEPNPERKEPESDEQPGNLKPDGRPNEIRATDADYRYKGGRQGVGEVPSPDERGDLERASKSSGIGARDTDANGKQDFGAAQDRIRHRNDRTRNLD